MEFQPMSPDEIERTVQFLLRQQARFEANMARIEADLATVAAQQARMGADLTSLAARQASFQTNLERLSAKTDNIADGLIGLTGIVGQLINKVDRVVDAFERHLRVDHGRLPS